MGSTNKPALLGNHQRCWIWGRHLVEATLRAGRWPVLEMLVSENLTSDRLSALCDAATQRGVMYHTVKPDRITNLCRHKDHQGVAAKMPPFPYNDVADCIGAPPAGKGLILCLDGIQDAYNAGAILRSGDVFGVQGVCLSNREQVGVTSMVARASAGAVNHLPISRVDDLAALLKTLRSSGVQVVGATEKGDMTPEAIEWTNPSALIMGNEARGISPDLLGCCDVLTRIPQRPGAVDSLNVAAAAAVIMYEAARSLRSRHNIVVT